MPGAGDVELERVSPRWLGKTCWEPLDQEPLHQTRAKTRPKAPPQLPHEIMLMVFGFATFSDGQLCSIVASCSYLRSIVVACLTKLETIRVLSSSDNSEVVPYDARGGHELRAQTNADRVLLWVSIGNSREQEDDNQAALCFLAARNVKYFIAHGITSRSIGFPSSTPFPGRSTITTLTLTDVAIGIGRLKIFFKGIRALINFSYTIKHERALYSAHSKQNRKLAANSFQLSTALLDSFADTLEKVELGGRDTVATPYVGTAIRRFSKLKDVTLQRNKLCEVATPGFYDVLPLMPTSIEKINLREWKGLVSCNHVVFQASLLETVETAGGGQVWDVWDSSIHSKPNGLWSWPLSDARVEKMK